MSPLDIPIAITGLIASAAFVVLWAVWVAADELMARRARRRGPGTPTHEPVAPLPACHVSGCPVPGFVPCYRNHRGRFETIHVCHGHADEGTAYGWWAREQGWQVGA